MDYRVLTEAERKYTFSQSQQLSMQTGLIGYLRADFGSNGNEFWTTWNDFRKDLKTDEFKAEFDDVINGLRDGDVLSGRNDMSSYCYSTPDSSFNDDRNHYGIRLDTEKYSYLMRFNPNRGEYNLYCYCYQKEWLNNHLKNAERGIEKRDIVRIVRNQHQRAQKQKQQRHRHHHELPLFFKKHHTVSTSRSR